MGLRGQRVDNPRIRTIPRALGVSTSLDLAQLRTILAVRAGRVILVAWAVPSLMVQVGLLAWAVPSLMVQVGLLARLDRLVA